MKISAEKINIVSEVSENPHQWGQHAVSIVFGVFSSKEDAEQAKRMVGEFIIKEFVYLEETKAPIVPKNIQ